MSDFNPDWICICGDLTTLGVVHRKDGPCYYPTKHEWVGLTDEEQQSVWIKTAIFDTHLTDILDFAKAIESKLKEKNT
jgi:hypothetical protein